MKILFLSPRFHTNMYYQLEALKGCEYDVTLFTLYRGKLESRINEFNIVQLGFSPVFEFFNKILGGKRVGHLKTNFELRFGFPPVFQLWRRMAGETPDIVFIKNIDSVYSIIGAVFARIFGAKVVFMLQIEKYRQKPKSISVEWVGRIFGAPVITPILGDDKFKNENQNLLYIPFCIKSIEDREVYFKNGKINIISVGKFVERKNHLLLLGVLTSLKDKYDFHLTIVGESVDQDYLDELKGFVKDNFLEKTVTLIFNQSWRETLKLYESHDVFVLASSDEPAAYSPLEAMSKGLAVVSSSANGTKCYIGKDNGRVFEDKNARDLSDAIEFFLVDRSRITSAGRSGLRLAKKEYSPDAFLTRLEPIISPEASH